MEIDLYSYYLMFRRRLWVIVLCVVLFTVPAALFTDEPYQPIYQASTDVYLHNTSTQSQHVDYNAIRIYLESPLMMSRVLQTYPDLPYSVEQLTKAVRVSETNGSRVLTITVRDASYDNAVLIANYVSHIFQTQQPEWLNVERIIVLNPAQHDDQPTPINAKSNRQVQLVVLGFIISIVLSIGIIFVLDVLDDTIKTAKDVHDIFDTPAWAVVPKMRRRDYKTKRKPLRNMVITTKEGIYVTKNE